MFLKISVLKISEDFEGASVMESAFSKVDGFQPVGLLKINFIMGIYLRIVRVLENYNCKIILLNT